MDCGEGTYGQLVRLFGLAKSNHVLSNLEAVYISHIHADHHIGLIGVLQGRRYALKKDSRPLLLIAPNQISYWLSSYDGNFESIASLYELIPNSNLLAEKKPAERDYVQLIKERLNLASVNTALVKHCPNAFGLSFQTMGGFRLTYSGDTMPCQALIDLGKDSDLLIHEATMEDGMEAEAKQKTHSTTSQVISRF